MGSATLGGYDRQRSDLDVQAVADGRLSLAERAALARELGHEALPCPARGLEFVLYAREDLGDPAGPAFQLNLNAGRDMPEHLAFAADEDPRFWFVIDVAIARQRGVTLAGAPPTGVLPEPPRALVVAALRDALCWYETRGGSREQTLLAACRAWAWATDGRWRSKPEARRWAGSPDHPAAVLDRARAALR